MAKKKEYVFTYAGTKEAFLENLDQFHSSRGKVYYLDDYLVEINGDEIRFGVQRGGHSGGYWFIPQITESDNRTEFRGTIQHIGPNSQYKPGALWRSGNLLGDFLLFLLVFPVVLIFKLYVIINKIIKIFRKTPKPREITTEDRLFDLMENYLDCTGKKE